MREMAYEVTAFPPSTESIKCKEGSLGSNNSNEPISVLDSRRSPSPSTSTSTLSSSFGGVVNGGTTKATTGGCCSPPIVGVSENTKNNLQQKWSESVPQEMGVSVPGSVTNPVGGNGGGGRKDEWSELQPIPAGFEVQQQRFGVGLDDWESLLSESAASPAQDQSLLRWISGDVEDTSFSLRQLLQGNPIDENAPATAIFEANNISLNHYSSSNLNSQNPNFFPVTYPDQKPQTFNPQMVLNPPPPAQIQFHQPGFQKSPVLDPGREFILKKQNQLLHENKPLMMVAAKQEPPTPAELHHLNLNHHQNQLICDQLFAAAELILSGNFSHAQGILARLNHQLPSSAMAPSKPFQRAAFYFKEAIQMAFLMLHSNSNPSSVVTNLTQRIVPTPFNGMFKMGAYKVLSEASPIIQFMNFTSNQTLLEALDDAQNIHIIDFDIGFGAQWSSFIQELPRRKSNNGGGCSLKITAFASPSTHHPIELGLMHENLSHFAREIGISFELEVVNFDSFDPSSFTVSGNEAIAVNFPIWSASTHLSAIPSLLHFIKQLSPKIVVSLDRGCERTDLPLPQYLVQGLQYYEVLLDSIDASNVGSETSNKIEKFLFQPQIESMVMGKLQFPEPMPHWKTLFIAGGYSPVMLSNFAEAQADCVVKRTQARGFHVEKRQASLVLCWQNRELMAATAWKC